MKLIKKITFWIMLFIFLPLLTSCPIRLTEVYNDDFYLFISGDNYDGDLFINGFKQGREQEDLYFDSQLPFQITSNGVKKKAFIRNIGSFENEYIIKSISFSKDKNARFDSIDDDAFANCINLTDVFIPDQMWYLGGFANCISLTSINTNDAFSIGYYAFAGCRNLKEVIIGKSISHIYNGAFMNCSEGLVVTILSDTPPSIGHDVFWGIKDYSIRIPSSTLDLYQNYRDISWDAYLDHIITY